MDGKFNSMLKILNLLDSGKSCTPGSLIEELDVSERTVFRYINSLKDAGFPIAFDEEKKTYTFQEGFALKRANLEKDEVLALRLAKKLLISLDPAAGETFNKLEKRIQESFSGWSSSKDHDLVFSPIRDRASTATIDIYNLIKMLIEACNNHNIVRLGYHSLHAQEHTQRDVEPHYLYYSPDDGFWHFRAYCRLREDWRTFALDKITSFQILDRYFLPRMMKKDTIEEVLGGFGPYVDGEPTKVVVRFYPETRPYVMRRKWHPSQETRILDDGWLELTFTTSGIEGVRKWLYGWIPYFIVDEPEELRHQILKELKQEARLLRSAMKTSGK